MGSTTINTFLAAGSQPPSVSTSSIVNPPEAPPPAALELPNKKPDGSSSRPGPEQQQYRNNQYYSDHCFHQYHHQHLHYYLGPQPLQAAPAYNNHHNGGAYFPYGPPHASVPAAAAAEQQQEQRALDHHHHHHQQQHPHSGGYFYYYCNAPPPNHHDGGGGAAHHDGHHHDGAPLPHHHNHHRPAASAPSTHHQQQHEHEPSNRNSSIPIVFQGSVPRNHLTHSFNRPSSRGCSGPPRNQAIMAPPNNLQQPRTEINSTGAKGILATDGSDEQEDSGVVSSNTNEGPLESNRPSYPTCRTEVEECRDCGDSPRITARSKTTTTASNSPGESKSDLSPALFLLAAAAGANDNDNGNRSSPKMRKKNRASSVGNSGQAAETALSPPALLLAAAQAITQTATAGSTSPTKLSPALLSAAATFMDSSSTGSVEKKNEGVVKVAKPVSAAARALTKKRAATAVSTIKDTTIKNQKPVKKQTATAASIGNASTIKKPKAFLTQQLRVLDGDSSQKIEGLQEICHLPSNFDHVPTKLNKLALPRKKFPSRSVPETDVILPIEFMPGPLDVITGRGKRNWKHSANLAFRDLIQTRATAYHAASTKSQKTDVVCSIANDLQKDGWRFVEHSQGLWYKLNSSKLRNKVAHALRDQQTAAKNGGAKLKAAQSLTACAAAADPKSLGPAAAATTQN